MYVLLVLDMIRPYLKIEDCENIYSNHRKIQMRIRK
jgi:hypothetical protein